MKCRLALIDPDPDSSLVQFIGKPVNGTKAERAMLVNVIRRFNRWSAKRTDVTLCLVIYPVKRKTATK